MKKKEKNFPPSRAIPLVIESYRTVTSASMPIVFISQIKEGEKNHL